MQAYLDCNEAQGQRLREYSSVGDVMRENDSRLLLVGSVVVIAGIVFVTVSVGAGVVVLAPLMLLTAS